MSSSPSSRPSAPFSSACAKPSSVSHLPTNAHLGLVWPCTSADLRAASRACALACICASGVQMAIGSRSTSCLVRSPSSNKRASCALPTESALWSSIRSYLLPASLARSLPRFLTCSLAHVLAHLLAHQVRRLPRAASGADRGPGMDRTHQPWAPCDRHAYQPRDPSL